MADLSYNVRVNTQQATSALNGLKTAFAGIAAAVSVTAITKFGDSVTNLQNKLRVISKDAQDAERQFRAIVQISNESRTSLADVATLYTRLAVAVGDMGRSQQDAAILTDTISKSLQLSGASAAEAGSAMLQLSQAFSSGVLRGEELNAVLESAPSLARILADSLGVTVGELRRLGEQGKLTSDAVAQAFIDANRTVTETFGKSVPTISQSFQRVQNDLAVVFANIENQTGVFRTLANAIIGLAVNLQSLVGFIQANAEQFKSLATIVLSVGGAFLVFTKVLPLVQTLTTGMYRLVTSSSTLSKQFAALGGHLTRAAGHFGRVRTAAGEAGSRIASLGLAISQLVKFVVRLSGIGLVFTAIAGAVGLLLDKFGITTGVTEGLGNAFDWLKEKIFGSSEETKKASTGLTDYVGALSTVKGEARNTAAQLARNAEELAKITGQLEANARAYYDNAQAQREALQAQIDSIGATREQISLTTNLGQAQQAYLQEVNRLLAEYQRLKTSTNEVEQQATGVIEQQLQRVTDAYRDQISAVRDLTAAQEARLKAQSLQEFSTQQQIRLEDELRKIERERARIGLTEIEKKYQDIRDSADDAYRAAVRAEEARRGSPLAQAELDEYYKRAHAGNRQLETEFKRMREQSRTFEAGWKKAFNEYQDAATNAADRAERVFKLTTKGMEDAIVGFAKTGKFEWRDFLNTILEELLRSQIRQTFAGLMTDLGSMNRGVTGGGGGGGGGGNLLGALGGLLTGGGQPSAPSTATPSFGGGGGGGSILGGLGKVASTLGGGLIDTISSAGSWINKNLFGGFFANGGTLPAGKFGIVGERGPEMISGPATVTPMSGATNVTYNINAVDAQSFKNMIARDPAFLFAVTEQGRRGTIGTRA